jgi:cobalamin biosynthesis protein CobT
MVFIRFSEWILAKESINSRSTVPRQQKKLFGKSRPKKKRKGGKKKNEYAPQNKAIDAFIRSVEELQKDLEILGKTKKRLEREKPESKDRVQKNKEKESEEKDQTQEDEETDSEEEKSEVQSKENPKKQSEKKT